MVLKTHGRAGWLASRQASGLYSPRNFNDTEPSGVGIAVN